MMGMLLWRGMLAGLVGALLAASFALVAVEPAVDAAIAYEQRHAPETGLTDEEPVSRATQKSAGLFTAMALYGVALGGMVAIAFAACHGRVTAARPRALALALALAGFVAVALVPALKYPPNPPAVGLHDTVRLRTAAFFAMEAWSIGAAIAALWVGRRVARGWSPLDRLLAALACYAALVLVAGALLPTVDEVPAGFPASLLWRFRIGSLAVQALFWLITADLFGRQAEHLLARTPAR